MTEKVADGAAKSTIFAGHGVFATLTLLVEAVLRFDKNASRLELKLAGDGKGGTLELAPASFHNPLR
jgi:hypothetical protein